MLAALGLISPSVGAQSSSTAAHPVPSPSVRAAERSGAITLDGRLDESAWQAAEPATGFTQSQPTEGAPATQRTEVRFLFDADAIYVGARMFDSLGAAGVRSRLGRRDQSLDSDWIRITFDTFHDHLGRTQFHVYPSGAIWDALGIGGSYPDDSWDPIWEARTAIDSLGWTAELRIPLSQLRFSRTTEQTWGVQLVRHVNRINERSQFAFWGLKEVGGPSRFGHLEGLRIPDAPRSAEIVPYVVGRGSYVEPPAPDDPFNDGSVLDYRVGADLKYLLTSNLTLDATINPDFGQVEVDPAVVNLSAFETFFPEKRPFFVAGAGIFSFGGLSCFFCSNVSSLSMFYSRRIGRTPQGRLPDDAEYADIPDNSTILGAAKITGRTSRGLTVGILDAVTREENAEVILADGTRLDHQVEPAANYFVARAKQDLRDGNLVFGGILTSVVRDLDGDGLSQRLSRHAEGVGLDMDLSWKQKTFNLTTKFAASRVSGEPEAILRLQRSSARYFQRPDRDGGGNGLFSDALDSSATSLTGYGGYARLSKDGGDWLWETALNFRSPGFEVNDLAFLTRADYAWMNANVMRQYTKPTNRYRFLLYILGAQQQYNYDADLTDRQAHAFTHIETTNYWNIAAMYIHRFEVFDDRATRGGPVVRRPASHFTSIFGSTDQRKPVVFDADFNYGWLPAGSFSYGVALEATFKPASNLSISIGPSFNRSGDIQQYVAEYDDPTAVDFFGRRYIFADLVQRSLSMNTRVNVTFTPALSFELFAQPLIASGDYRGFKEFTAPRELAKRLYGTAGSTIDTIAGDDVDASYTVDADGSGPAPAFTFGNPDFNFRSLRGNAVLRWEYRPGSTIFFVWTQARRDIAPEGDFAFPRDRSALFRAHPDNIFLVKVNYWIEL